MISKREIMEAASVLSLRPQVVEKDYVLGWVLAGINAHPRLASGFVFKGGTCLKKCFFETYRFSEDLDFTVTKPGLVDQSVLTAAFSEVCDWVYMESGIETFRDRLRFDVYRNSRTKTSCEGRFYYRGPVSPRGDPPRIKLDLTSDEILAVEPVIREVAHPFSDIPKGGFHIRCYAFEEIFAEKIRALGERCRPRDLYDVIHLFRREGSGDLARSVFEILKKKCRFKRIGVPTLEALATQRDQLDAEWEHMLAHQLQALPPAADFWGALADFFAWLTTPTVVASAKVAVVSPSGSPVSRSEFGGGSGGYVPGASAMETIYFAAANRLCIDLTYDRRIRRLEPYSLRRTNDGHLLFYGVKANTGETRAYRVDRIQGATVTSQSFLPRFVIELTGSGPTAVPPARPKRSRTPKSTGHWPQSSSVVRYVYECPVCGRKFVRKKRSTSLRPHKDGHGFPCPSRRAIFIETTRR